VIQEYKGQRFINSKDPDGFYASAILCDLLKVTIFRQPGSAINARAAAILSFPLYRLLTRHYKYHTKHAAKISDFHDISKCCGKKESKYLEMHREMRIFAA
jgi:hypothetical protein